MYEYKAIITRVVDGDTYDAIVDLGFGVGFGIRLRLNNVDTPETWRPVNEAEAEHGKLATDFVQNLIDNNPHVRIVTYKIGSSVYGRYTADVFVTDYNGDERSLGELLVEQNLVKRTGY